MGRRTRPKFSFCFFYRRRGRRQMGAEGTLKRGAKGTVPPEGERNPAEGGCFASFIQLYMKWYCSTEIVEILRIFLPVPNLYIYIICLYIMHYLSYINISSQFIWMRRLPEQSSREENSNNVKNCRINELQQAGDIQYYCMYEIYFMMYLDRVFYAESDCIFIFPPIIIVQLNYSTNHS